MHDNDTRLAMLRTLRRTFLAAALLFAGTWPVWALEAPHDSTNSIDCSDCHALHGALLPRKAEQETMCKSCHNPTGQGSDLSTDLSMHVDPDGGTTAIDCGTCHDVHAPMESADTHTGGSTTDNIKLIRSDPDKYISGALSTLVYQSDPSHQIFSSSPYNGLCQACHTTTDFHTNTGAGSTHESSKDCTSCHPHGDGFAASGCTACHASAQDDGDGTPTNGRRAIVGEFAYDSSHIASTSLEDADCEVCHEQTEHKDGSVRLFDVDDPTTSTSVTELSGDPNTSATVAADLDDFCLACHDSDGADGDTTPFSDGSSVIAMDATAWAASSHSTNSVGCYGDGDTFGCHASGHGSKKLTLLAPWATSPSTPSLTEEEEGFCFECHTSGGTADSDVESDFSASINWVGDGAGSNDSDTLNDRHDIEYAAQNTSGAVIECWDCHDPHAAKSTAKLIPDPDPNDNHDPSDTDDYYFSDSTAMTEWCLDCHDGSLPSGITGPTTSLTNILSAYTDDDTHGDVNGSPKLKSGYGWASSQFVQCLDCHAPHNGARSNGNLFQLKDAVYSKDGSTAVPCDRSSPDQYTYECSDNNTSTQAVNGFQWCNTCHTNSMGKNKSNCFNCHYHGKNM